MATTEVRERKKEGEKTGQKRGRSTKENAENGCQSQKV